MSWPANSRWPDGENWPNEGQWPGGVAPGPPSVAPLYNFVTGATVLWAHRSTDVTQAAGTVSAIADLTGNGFTYAQAGGAAAEGIYNASDGPGAAHPSVSGDGVARYLSFPWNPAGVATTPIFKLAIWRLNAWTSARVLWGDGSGTGRISLVCTPASPQIACRNNTISPTKTVVIGSWVMAWELYTGTAGQDGFRIGSNETTLHATGWGGVNPDGPFGLFAQGNGVSFCNVSWVEDFACAGMPSNMAAIYTQIASYYGAGLT